MSTPQSPYPNTPGQPGGYPPPAGGQSGYPGAQPGYGPSGGPAPYNAPGYPMSPGMNPAGAGARPGSVTGAAVLAFIVGGLQILGGLLIFAASTLIGSGYTVLAILSIVIGAVFIWAGVQAMSGKNGQLLVIIAGIAIVLGIISMISAGGFSGVLGVVISIIIVALLLQAPSKAWFQARGGKTF